MGDVIMRTQNLEYVKDIEKNDVKNQEKLLKLMETENTPIFYKRKLQNRFLNDHNRLLLDLKRKNEE